MTVNSFKGYLFNGFYLYKVFNNLNHTENHFRILVYYAVVNLTKTQSSEVFTLLSRSSDAADGLCNFQLCQSSSDN